MRFLVSVCAAFGSLVERLERNEELVPHGTKRLADRVELCRVREAQDALNFLRLDVKSSGKFGRVDVRAIGRHDE